MKENPKLYENMPKLYQIHNPGLFFYGKDQNPIKI
jgi:hypothetical protein